MTTPVSKRLTQLDLQKLARLRGPLSIPDCRKQGKSEKENDVTPGKRRAVSPCNEVPGISSGLYNLDLPKVVESGLRAYEYVAVKPASPWESYKKKYDLQLDGFITVAMRKAPSYKVVTIKSLPIQESENKVHMLQRLRHDRLVTLLDLFMYDGSVHVVLEHMPVSLQQIVASPAFPNEGQLAAIFGQILQGLAYLHAQGLEHSSLTCTNVLLSPEGDIKIANQECCRRSSTNGKNPCGDLRALGCIAMKLMQKYAKDDATIGVEDLERWPADSNAVSFLSQAISASSVTELIKHPLVSLGWHKKELQWIWDLAMISVGRRFKYHE